MSKKEEWAELKKDKNFHDKQVLKLFVKRENEIQSRFESALAMEFLTDIQGQNDTNIILKKLVEWRKKAKNSEQKESLLMLIQTLFRVQTYVQSKAILAKKATAEYITYKNENKALNIQNAQLTKDNNSLKKMIKYYEKEAKAKTD